MNHKGRHRKFTNPEELEEQRKQEEEERRYKHSLIFVFRQNNFMKYFQAEKSEG